MFENLDINVFDRVPPDAIYNFSRQLSVMLKAGVPLIDSLESMLSKTINPLFNKTIEKIIEDSFPKIITVARLDKRKGHDKI